MSVNNPTFMNQRMMNKITKTSCTMDKNDVSFVNFHSWITFNTPRSTFESLFLQCIYLNHNSFYSSNGSFWKRKSTKRTQNIIYAHVMRNKYLNFILRYIHMLFLSISLALYIGWIENHHIAKHWRMRSHLTLHTISPPSSKWSD